MQFSNHMLYNVDPKRYAPIYREQLSFWIYVCQGQSVIHQFQEVESDFILKECDHKQLFLITIILLRIISESYFSWIQTLFIYRINIMKIQLDTQQQNFINKLAAQHIKRKILQKFKSQYQKKFKNQDRIPQTILSAFLLYDCSISNIFDKAMQKEKICNRQLFKIVSIGFGTKSLPYSVASKYKGQIIKDMHAQILANKGFHKFIVENLPQKQQQNKYFSWNTHQKKHSLHSKYKILLYSSQIFCGDCCIDEAVSLFSGAKPLQFYNMSVIPQQKYLKGCLRTKPGRLDLPISKRSLSLSCSDKIALWNILGIQGKRLFKLICPIYIDCIIMQMNKKGIQNEEKANEKIIIQGIDFIKRISMRKQISMEQTISKILYIPICGKLRLISHQFIINQPRFLFVQNLERQNIATNQAQQVVLKNQKQAVFGSKKLQLSGIIYQKKVEWISGKTGLPEGVSINKIQQKSISQFSTNKIYKNMAQIRDLGPQSYHSTQEIFKYMAVKQNIKKLFGIWTTQFKNPLLKIKQNN